MQSLQEQAGIPTVFIEASGDTLPQAYRTLGALLEELRLSPSAVVVERNRDIVPRESLRDLVLADGDRLEIVRLVGGG